MTTATRIFTVSRTRAENGAIVDAAGWTGRWPFRRSISYHVGVNCDSITLGDGRVHVYRRGWTIAVGENRPNARTRWTALLFPRHARKRSPWAW